MSDTAEPSIWATYNAAQSDRAVRPLCLEVIELAGPGNGRTAIDLGCGLGRETDALLGAGWRTHAVDWEEGTRANLTASTAREHRERLTIQIAGFAELADLPGADLVYSGYSLPYIAPEDFARLWGVLRAALRPGAWCAVNLLGDRDSYAQTETGTYTFLPEPEARALFDGMELVKFEVEDRDGNAFGGPKHWHLYNVIARLPE
ncbi:class I SAM-dependent methyltransferase [Solihabitans fulvus]|uniref:Class I SAM-dependent methyltransferase n=1 Tax=Solihabitans fulvus TaxID=1892852 RepID=A0A5B2X0L3_9PSEU|nr:class I SAM-dependent methyltransferase [Solihabitans fulvus]KAA2256920.1 class I SAM-dependent methyltransferase [Solihabitans fulvus]